MLAMSPEEAEAIRSMFVCMRNEYNWSENRPAVPDPRVVTKANEEYHGFQRHAGQYAASAMYDEAAKYFREAASLRENIIQTHPQLSDERHEKAILVCKKLAAFYTALHQWQEGPDRLDCSRAPKPASYGLTDGIVRKLEREGQAQLDEAQHKSALTHS